MAETAAGVERELIVRFPNSEARDDINRVSGSCRRSLLIEVHRGKECIGVDFLRCRRPLLNFLQAEL